MSKKSKAKDKDKAPLVLVPRKKRAERADEHRRELYATILDYMAGSAKWFQNYGALDAGAWAADANVFVNKMITDMPQDAEVIRQVAGRAEASMRRTLDMVDKKLAAYRMAIYRHILAVTQVEGVSRHPDVNLERFLELVGEWEKAFASELPENARRQAMRAAASVREMLANSVERHRETDSLETFLATMAKGE